MIFKVLFYAYIILKWQAMMNKKDWRLTIQDLVSPFELLEYSHKFSKPLYQNISMGIQIMPSRPMQTKSAMSSSLFNNNAIGGMQAAVPGSSQQGAGGGRNAGGPRRRLQNQTATPVAFNSTTYEQDVLKISKYVSLYGMFETFDGRNYSVHDTNVNENLFNWKKYESII